MESGLCDRGGRMAADVGAWLIGVRRCGPWQACLFSVDFSLDALGWAHCTSTIASDVHAASVVCSTIER